MPSLDVVNKLDMQKIDNGINVANRKISQRYDFRGAHILVELNKKDKTLKVEVPDDMKLKAVQEIVNGSLHDQGVSPKIIDWGKKEDASLGAIRLNCKLVEGIEKDIAKIITTKIKESGLKLKTQIQGDQVRIEGKSIDDLQEAMALLRATPEITVPLQFDNMKR
ncbi:MAG TPA: YajQ family cyclic di-GMP-binding protein [Candidatus Sumerlaeota bacterium]|nr:YajQ family cyclic di-GMP-binding protein [Candidatus Sumerlaeota bacterium]HNM46158.1 YajQ family cyclic di-GMP-binding protein [Candidatus Sumerlaeota bacterium]